VQPSTYLAPPLARATEVSNIDPTAAFPFGAGIGYTTFDWSGLEGGTESVATDGSVRLALTVTNTGHREGSEVVQLYVHDPVASVVRPVQRLIGFTKVRLAAGASVRVSVEVPVELASFTGRAGERIIEPGELEFGFGRSSGDIPLRQVVDVTGPLRVLGNDRALHPLWSH
jgi:beta-xylosidase